jgi:hypothetical protein
MKMSPDNALKIFMLFMGILLTCTVFFQQNTKYTLTEISLESDSLTTFFDTDLEINEHYFLFCEEDRLLSARHFRKKIIFYSIGIFPTSSMSVWQPPKLV